MTPTQYKTAINRMSEAADALDAAESNMTPKQYVDALERLGMSQRFAGRFLGVDERTSRRWVSGDSTVPESVGKLLRLMIKQGLKPEDVR